MEGKINFSASSPVMPKEVIERINKNIINFKNSGFSALELNYKNPLFIDLMNETKEILTKLLHLNDEMEILFINGGGSMHFDMVPLNFTNEGDTVSIINSDLWTNNAVNEAKKYVKVDEIGLINHKGPLPKITLDDINKESKYLFMCTNNTSSGSKFNKDKIPDVKGIPLISDMTSNLLSETYDINKFDLSFASSAKNMGTSGISVVIVNKKLFDIKTNRSIPKILSYKDYYYSGNSFTTPNTFAVYIIYEMVKYLYENGGVEEIEKINIEKSNLLYDFIDNSKFYSNDILKEDRSVTSLIFNVKNNDNFIKEASKHDIINISTSMNNAVRVGLYNGVSIENVKKLIDFMYDYEKKNI